MRKVFSLFFIIAFFIPGILISQTISLHSKPNPKIDYARLKKVDNLVNEYVHKKWIAGAVTLIVKDNELIQYKGYGFKDLETKKRMDSNSIFRLASQTKAITSVGILMLYEAGKLMLDEPISDFIPSFKNPRVLDKYNASDTTFTTVPAKREITFRDVLTHSSGIDYAGIGSEKMKAIYAKAKIPSGLGKIDENLIEKMTQLGKQPLYFQPGEKWQYGLNTDLLGALIEIISGTDLETFFRNNIFMPLGMNDTYFNVPLNKAGRLANVYTEDSLNNLKKWGHTFRSIDSDYPILAKTYFSGGAGLSSTAYDYAIFLQMLLNGGTYNGRQILARRTIENMLSGQLDFMFNGVNNFGLGFEIVSDKGAAREPRNKGSFSWGGYFGTTYWADPKEKLICLIMTQQSPNSHSELMKKIENIIYASLK